MPAFLVSAAEAGRSLLDVLRSRLELSRAAAHRLLEQRRVRLAGSLCHDPGRCVRRGQRVEVSERPRAAGAKRPAPASRSARGSRPRRADAAFVIRFADAHVLVVDKPAGLTTMRHADEAAEFGARARRFLPPTLADLLSAQLAAEGKPSRLRPVHRLDKDTSGLVVFARTPAAERDLGRQFREHTTERRYLALVRGHAQPGRIESYLVADRGDARRGSTAGPNEGKRAVTHMRVIEELGDFTLVECRLETGRTHQVRIHLGEAGTPLCAERIYDRPVHGRPYPDTSGAPRLALHAATLGFTHPATGKPMHWKSQLPRDLQTLVNRLRARARGRPGEPD
jgi:23S rRNA pseudouridine1911/1915/1917 synthase